MPSITENQQNWSNAWDWSQAGEEWSLWWGDTPSFWHGAIFPRIHAMVPTGTILEIAPGYGRWTQYLKDLCERIVIVDLTEQCIAHCQKRFADVTNIEYHVNDGRALTMIGDETVDFAFSFDSLVHSEPEVLAAYLEQLATKLKPDGVGFLHHSNTGSLRRLHALSRRLPGALMASLIRQGIAVNVPAWRDDRMTADLFHRQCQAAGLACVAQELVSWEYGHYLIDCFSVFARPGSCWDRPLTRVRNRMFATEGGRAARLYSQTSFG